MKQAQSITISVFVKPEDPPEYNVRCVEVIKELSGLSLEKEKLAVTTELVEGFNNRTIKIYILKLLKESHTNTVLAHVLSMFNKNQLELLRLQKESRLDEDFNFFIRLGKEELLHNEIFLTDSGDCFHIRIVLAVFPKKKVPALALLDRIFDKYINDIVQK